MNDTPVENTGLAPIATRPSNSMATQMAGTQALVQRSLAEVQVAVMMAKQFPRDIISVKENLMIDCCRPELAEKAMYEYSRGGTKITGPSIRLAEAAERAWGNMQSGWRELSRTTVQGVGQSEIEAFCWDTETNTRSSVTFTVRHWRDTKQGGYALKEERDIYELCANQASRRKRACILQRIDGGIIADAINQCETTLHTKIKVTPENISAMLSKFKEEYGITQDQVQKRIQCRVEAMTPGLMISLGKIYTSLKDGMSKPEDWFEPEPKAEDETAAAQTKTDEVKNKLKKQEKAKSAGANTETGELPPENKTIPDPEQRETESVTLDKSKKESFSAAALPMRDKPRANLQDPIKPDYDAWYNEWKARVDLAGTDEQLMLLHKNNQIIFKKMQEISNSHFEACMLLFNTKRAELEGVA